MAEHDHNQRALTRQTRLVHSASGAGASLPAESVAPAIQRASTVLMPNAASLYDHNAPTYGRQGLASQKALSSAICDLEGASFCQLYGSGLAAVTGALTSILHSGDTLLVTDGVYQPVRRFCDGFLTRFGVTTLYFPADATPQEVAAYFTPNTRAILLESPASLTFEMMDVAAVAQAARADDSKRVLKAKLEAVTGIPAAQQKLLLSGFSQLAIGDRRSNIRFGTCGRAEGCGIAWEAAAAGKPPHVPPRSANRVDNKGNWTDDGGRGGAA